MGPPSSRKITVLIFCFAVTGILVYWMPGSRGAYKEKPLGEALLGIDGWRSSGVVPMEKKIVDALELDGYANQFYSNGDTTVMLYIGYYLTTKKVGAAHDPLVCFPGQGWAVSNTNKEKKTLKTGETIDYSSMLAGQGLKKEFIVYWFQSYDQTSADTFSQKIKSLMNRVSKGREDNAFVRVSMEVGDRSIEECRNIIFNFMESFYPVFLDYVKS